MHRVKDKVILITGAARGMGAAHARLLAAEGAALVLTDVLDADGEKLAAELGATACYLHLDVTDPAQWKAVVQQALERFGRVDVLVNNAGIATMAKAVDFDLKIWQKTLDINLTGTFIGMQAVIPAMAAQKSGSIINISSVEGLRGSALLHAYVASKFGVRGITKSVAVEVARHNIRVNSIHPGFIATPMTQSLSADQLQIPMQRGAKPEEVSGLVLMLASDEAAYCTGSEFVCDGGLTAGIPHA